MASEPSRRLRGLYAVTPEIEDTRVLLSCVEACLAGGAAIVQYRAKQAPRTLAHEQARALARLCQAHDVPFIVNDSIELAIAAGAAGVHLGRDDADAREARAAFPDGLVGVSCYDDPNRARAAAEAGADYVAIGSLFPSPTKPGAPLARLESLAAARASSGLPVAAIGGITRENAREAIAAGADMLAVISAVFDAQDVTGAARSIARLFETPSASSHAAQPRSL